MLSPEAFSVMTPGEFMAAVEGAKDRDYRHRAEIAWATCYIINYCSERPRQGQRVQPAEMLGPEYQQRLAAALEEDKLKKERASVRARREERRR